ncbi:MAG: monovalent cation/H(+) antiporter subunit G [Acidimicrobiales bacterium]
MISTVGELVVFAGALLILVAGIGVIRLRDVLSRMHALAKASTAGVVLVLLGAALVLRSTADVTSVLLAAVLQLLTSPVSATLVSRATYRAPGIPHPLDAGDDLADDGGEGR